MNWFFLAVMASLGTSQAGTEGETYSKHGGTSLALYAKYVLKGNYIVGSCGLRFNGGQCTINLSGLPASPDIVKAYLIYSVIAATEQPQGNLNGTPVNGVLRGTGPTPCWFGYPDIYTYVADVTNIVRATGNGTYNLTGFYDPGGSPYSPAGADGASLVVIFCDNGSVIRTIVIYLGAYTLDASDDPSTYNWNLANFTATNPVTSARTTLIFADGQDYFWESYWGKPTGLEYVYFNGNLIRSGQYGLPGGDGNLWDAVHISNAASYIPGGASSVSGQLTTERDASNARDCITAVAHILSVSSVEAETYYCGPVSSEEEFAGDEFSLRAAGNRVLLSLPFPVSGNMRLYSSDGRLVRVLADGKLTSGEVEIPPLEPGVYFLKLRTEIGAAEAKVIASD